MWRAYLYNATEVAVGSQFQALFLGPGLYVAELLAQNSTPVVWAQAWVWLRHQLVEEPHVNEVEKLREQLDSEGCIYTTAAQQRHGTSQGVQHVLWGERIRTMSGIAGHVDFLGVKEALY